MLVVAAESQVPPAHSDPAHGTEGSQIAEQQGGPYSPKEGRVDFGGPGSAPLPASTLCSHAGPAVTSTPCLVWEAQPKEETPVGDPGEACLAGSRSPSRLYQQAFPGGSGGLRLLDASSTPNPHLCCRTRAVPLRTWEASGALPPGEPLR